MPDPRILDTPADLKQRLGAEREGVPFLYFRDGDGTQRIVRLGSDREILSVGRDEECDLCLHWDGGVSRLHARLEHSGGSWTVYDGGLSRNGTFVNGERVHGHCVLEDQDRLLLGSTTIAFRDTTHRRSRTIALGTGPAGHPVSPAQRKVLLALCRPFKHHATFARPASNQEIADELVLSVDAVKSHLRAMFVKFDLENLPQNEKRMRLVEQAFLHGLVRDSEL